MIMKTNLRKMILWTIALLAISIMTTSSVNPGLIGYFHEISLSVVYFRHISISVEFVGILCFPVSDGGRI